MKLGRFSSDLRHITQPPSCSQETSHQVGAEEWLVTKIPSVIRSSILMIRIWRCLKNSIFSLQYVVDAKFLSACSHDEFYPRDEICALISEMGFVFSLYDVMAVWTIADRVILAESLGWVSRVEQMLSSSRWNALNSELLILPFCALMLYAPEVDFGVAWQQDYIIDSWMSVYIRVVDFHLRENHCFFKICNHIW